MQESKTESGDFAGRVAFMGEMVGQSSPLTVRNPIAHVLIKASGYGMTKPRVEILRRRIGKASYRRSWLDGRWWQGAEKIRHAHSRLCTRCLIAPFVGKVSFQDVWSGTEMPKKSLVYAKA